MKLMTLSTAKNNVIHDTQVSMGAIKSWRAGDKEICLVKPVVMGILNVTPDSFYDGGRYPDSESACMYAEHLLQEGADILDVGGESTRPGSQPVDARTEIKRVVPVIERIIAEFDAVVSVDTCKAEVARAAVNAGARIVNDVSGMRDLAMAAVLRESGAGYVLMHMHGEPKTMQKAPLSAESVMSAVSSFFKERLAVCAQQNVDPATVVIDPGIGFGKTYSANEVLLARLSELRQLNKPVLVGASRKRFIGERTGREAHERLAGSLAAHVLAYMNGAQIIRTHDVRETRDALAVAEAISAVAEKHTQE